MSYVGLICVLCLQRRWLSVINKVFSKFFVKFDQKNQMKILIILFHMKTRVSFIYFVNDCIHLEFFNFSSSSLGRLLMDISSVGTHFCLRLCNITNLSSKIQVSPSSINLFVLFLFLNQQLWQL